MHSTRVAQGGSGFQCARHSMSPLFRVLFLRTPPFLAVPRCRTWTWCGADLGPLFCFPLSPSLFFNEAPPSHRCRRRRKRTLNRVVPATRMEVEQQRTKRFWSFSSQREEAQFQGSRLESYESYHWCCHLDVTQRLYHRPRIGRQATAAVCVRRCG